MHSTFRARRTPAGPASGRRANAFLHSRRGRRLADAYAEDAARLVDVAPEIDLSLWPSVADLA